MNEEERWLCEHPLEQLVITGHSAASNGPNEGGFGRLIIFCKRCGNLLKFVPAKDFVDRQVRAQ